jgi:hypothetical protein
MKLLLALLTILLAPSVALAAPRVDRIEITEYGIYDTVTASYGVDANGIRENVETNIQHVKTTTEIPAKPHLAFGLKYKLIGAPAGDLVEVRRVVVFPKGGLRPKGKPAQKILDRRDEAAIGEEGFTDYKFDEAWELVPGPWTFQFWIGGRKLAEKTFIVVADDAPVS